MEEGKDRETVRLAEEWQQRVDRMVLYVRVQAVGINKRTVSLVEYGTDRNWLEQLPPHGTTMSMSACGLRCLPRTPMPCWRYWT